LSAGLQKTDYRKRILQPGMAATATRDRPWLGNVMAAAFLGEALAVYAGYTRGLEESGVAPANATNRNEALPAITTRQVEAGLRLGLARMKLVAGVFDVRKPYFSLDAANRFAELGDVKNQGLEVSLTGALAQHLDIVAGVVLLRPRVTGEGVTLGRLGDRPVGIPTRQIDLNADWRIPQLLDGLSLDASVSHSGPIVATRDNLVRIPARTLVDVGARYAFALAGARLALRVAVTNLFDQEGFELRGAGAYDTIPGRVFGARVAVDL
jgi:iron complex outermembrane receptor protein